MYVTNVGTFLIILLLLESTIRSLFFLELVSHLDAKPFEFLPEIPVIALCRSDLFNMALDQYVRGLG